MKTVVYFVRHAEPDDHSHDDRTRGLSLKGMQDRSLVTAFLQNFEEATNMKCYTQVYVMDSLSAVENYCRAFGAEVTFAIKNDAQTAYEHCELSVNGEPIHELPWSKCCATVMDRYGVCWWVAI